MKNMVILTLSKTSAVVLHSEVHGQVYAQATVVAVKDKRSHQIQEPHPVLHTIDLPYNPTSDPPCGSMVT